MSKYAESRRRSEMRHSKDFRNSKLGYPVDRVSEKAEPVEQPDEKPAVKPEAPADAIAQLKQSIEKAMTSYQQTLTSYQQTNEARFEKVCSTMIKNQQTSEARFKKNEEKLEDIQGQINELTRVTSGQKGQVTKLNAMAISHDERLGQMYTAEQVHQMLEQMLVATSMANTSAPVVEPAPVVKPTPAVEPAPAPAVEPATAPVVEPAVAPASQPVSAPASTKKSEAPRYVGSKKYYVIEDPFGVDGHKYDLCHPFEILDAEASGSNWATWKYWVREDGALVPYTLSEMRVSVLNRRAALLN